MARIAVAVSGGVDSLCALCRLREEGHDLLALHGLFLPSANTEATAGGVLPSGGLPLSAAADAPRLWHVPTVEESAPAPLAPDMPAGLTDGGLAAVSPALPGLRTACRRLGVPLYLLDARQRFAQAVVAPFVRAYAQGRTPNPCALCNASIKFGVLLDAARRLCAMTLATGHYARCAVSPSEGQRLLVPATDAQKDQAYFLALVPPDALQHVLFPLAGLTKQDCRALVAAAGLTVPVPGESQEICFIPAGEDAYRDFLGRRWAAEGIPPPPGGPVLLRTPGGERPIARHDGLWRYTEGQRRGLGIAHSEPLYVLGKDAARQALLVGGRALLAMRACRTGPANLFLPDMAARISSSCNGAPLFVRLRYRQRPVPADVRLLPDGGLHIQLDTAHGPHFPSAPGQIAAVYDAAGRLLAGAVIEAVS